MPRLLLATLLGLLACGDGGASRTTLDYYFTYDPRSLDPALSTDVPTGEMAALLFDNLTQFDPEGSLKPSLARRWEVSPDGLRYTFHLRTDATFHDGRPVSADDVRKSLERTLALERSGARGWPLHPIRGARAFAAGTRRGVEGIAVPNDSTVVFTLEEPLNIFPKLLAMPATAVVPTPVPQGFDQAPVGSGPWRFVSWAHDDALVLARHPTYWGGPPLADTLRIRIIPEPLTQAAEYEAGHLSIVEIPFGETSRWQRTRPAELQRRPALRVLYIAMNVTRGPLADPRVRRALNHAVDVPTMLRTIMGGRGLPSAGALPPGVSGHDSSRAPFGYDTTAARRLLTEAGYPQGFSLKLWRTQRAELARIAQSVQQNLAAVGVRAEIVERDASSARAASTKGEADLFLTDWYGDYPDPENFAYPLFHSRNRGAGGNRAFFADAAIDSLILAARATPDLAEAARLWQEIDRRVFEAAPWIFLWFPVDLWAVRPDVEGYRIPAIFNGQRWRDVRRAR